MYLLTGYLRSFYTYPYLLHLNIKSNQTHLYTKRQIFITYKQNTEKDDRKRLKITTDGNWGYVGLFKNAVLLINFYTSFHSILKRTIDIDINSYKL